MNLKPYSSLQPRSIVDYRLRTACFGTSRFLFDVSCVHARDAAAVVDVSEEHDDKEENNDARVEPLAVRAVRHEQCAPAKQP